IGAVTSGDNSAVRAEPTSRPAVVLHHAIKLRHLKAIAVFAWLRVAVDAHPPTLIHLMLPASRVLVQRVLAERDTQIGQLAKGDGNTWFSHGSLSRSPMVQMRRSRSRRPTWERGTSSTALGPLPAVAGCTSLPTQPRGSVQRCGWGLPRW